jgi:hypothetical protein
MVQGIKMYASLLLPWSDHPDKYEKRYKSAGLMKTKGTIFLLPPSEKELREAYNAPPRPKTRMSSGAVALCKHFERGGCSADPSKGKDLHPFWKMPLGSNENKSGIAGDILEEMLSDAIWRNVVWLHESVAVYEIRNARGYGMRWMLDTERGVSGMMNQEGDEEENFKILKTTFRGFLEPIEGLDHEIDGAQAPK